MINAHRVNPRLHRVLHEQIPRTGRLENVESLDHEAYAMVRVYFETRRDEIAIADLDMAAFICVKTVETLTHTAVINRSDIVTGDRMHAFVDQVAGLVIGYLKASQAQ